MARKTSKDDEVSKIGGGNSIIPQVAAYAQDQSGASAGRDAVRGGVPVDDMRLARGAARGRHPRAGVPSNRRWSVAVAGIAQAAEKLGMETGAGLATTDSLSHRSTAPACCTGTRTISWCSSAPTAGRAASRIAEPAKGKRWMDRAEFESHWISDRKDPEHPRGIAMTFGPGPDFHRRAESFRRVTEAGHGNPLRLILRYLGKYRGTLAKVAVALLAATILQLILPFLTQQIVDTGIRNRDIGFVWLILLGELAIVSGRTLTDFFQAARAAADVDEGERVARVGFLRETAPPPHGILRHETLGRPAPAHRRPPPGGDLSHRAGDRHPLHRTQLPGVRHGASRIRPPYLRRVRGLERGLRFLDGLVPAAARGAGPRDVRGSVAQQLAHMAARHLDAGDKASGMRRTAHSGVGRDPDGAVRTPDAFAEAGADAGSRLGSHQRDAQHTHHSDRGHRGDLGRHLAGRDAGRAVCGRTAVVARGADDGVRLRTAGRAPLARPHRGGAHPPDEDEAAARTLHGDDAEDSGPENSGAEESAPAGGASGCRVYPSATTRMPRS